PFGLQVQGDGEGRTGVGVGDGNGTGEGDGEGDGRGVGVGVGPGDGGGGPSTPGGWAPPPGPPGSGLELDPAAPGAAVGLGAPGSLISDRSGAKAPVRAANIAGWSPSMPNAQMPTPRLWARSASCALSARDVGSS